MTGTALDMTSPRQGSSGPVYGVYGEPGPTAVTFEQMDAACVTVRQLPLDVLVALETGLSALHDEALARVGEHHGRTLVGAVGFDDWWTTALTALNPAFPLAAARRLVTDKAALYQRLAQCGATVPRFIHGRLSADLLGTALEQLGPRPILKPATGAGSRGVYRYNSALSVADNLALYRHVLALGHIDSGISILAAEYLGGDQPLEVSVDAIVCAGVAIHQVVHEKLTATQVHPFVDRVMVTPPVHTTIVEALPQLPAAVASIITALDLADGALHAELRLHQGLWYVLDVGVRPGAGLVPHAVRARTGVDPRIVHLAASIGRPLEATAVLAAQPSHSAAGIACCYVADEHRDRVTLTRQAELAVLLRKTPDVFGWHLNTSEVNDDVYRPDSGLSIGMGAATPEQALLRLRSITEPFAYSIS